MKVQLQPENLRHIKVSKNRNITNKSVEFTDSSGKSIKGHPVRHFINTSQLQQARFDTKFEAFSQLSQDELKQIYTDLESGKKDKTKVSSSTDKAALIQAYYNSCFEAYKSQNKADLDTIEGNMLDNLNNVEKQALIDSKKLKEQELQLKTETKEK